MAVQLNLDQKTSTCIEKRPELWPSSWILCHDNAAAHKMLSVKQCLVQKSITKMEHSPCSPDLAPYIL